MMALMELSGTGSSATELPGAKLSGTRHFATEFPEAELSAMELSPAGFPSCACIPCLKTRVFPDEETKKQAGRQPVLLFMIDKSSVIYHSFFNVTNTNFCTCDEIA